MLQLSLCQKLNLASEWMRQTSNLARKLRVKDWCTADMHMTISTTDLAAAVYILYTLLKSDVTRHDHVVRCRGSQECGSRFVNFAC